MKYSKGKRLSKLFLFMETGMCYEIQSEKNPGIFRMKQLDGDRFILAIINTMCKLFLNPSQLWPLLISE